MKNNDNELPNFNEVFERLMRMSHEERLQVIDTYLHARRLPPAERKKLIEDLLFTERVRDHIRGNKYPLPEGEPLCSN